MPANTDQRVDIRKYDENFDRIFRQSDMKENSSGSDVYTITVFKNDTVIFKRRYKELKIDESRTVSPEYKIGCTEVSGLHIERGSEVLTITAGDAAHE